jgi:hypothetical protein
MKIFIICSKRFYDRIPPIKEELEKQGHLITLPNSYDDPAAEEKQRDSGSERHARWKAKMLRHSTHVIERNDAVLVLNFEKDGIKNYIGGATFIEMYDAFRLEKTIFLFNQIPEGILRDEILGFSPIIIDGDVRKVT